MNPSAPSAWCVCLALSLLHFLWQGLLVACLAEAAGWLLRRASAESRYFVYLAAMLLMVACPLATVVVLSGRGSPVVEVSPGASGSLSAAVRVAQGRAGLRSHPHSLARQDSVGAGAALSTARELLGAPATASFEPLAPAVQPPVVADSPWRRLAPYATVAYLLGVLLMSVRLAVALQGGARLRRHTTLVEEPLLLETIRRQAELLRLKVVPAVAYCERVAVPVVVGVLRPMILLPLSLSTGLTPDQAAGIVAHELAHIRRHDHWLNLVQRMIEVVLYFHPAVWHVSRRLSMERENCCDDLAVAAGAARHAYAESLLRVAELGLAARGRRLAAPAVMGAVGRPSRLHNRIRRLLGEPSHQPVRLARTWPLGLALAAAALVGGSLWLRAYAAPPVQPPKDQTGASGSAAEKDGDGKDSSPVLYRIRPLDLLTIRAVGTLADGPIDGTYLIESSGEVALGPFYGRVDLKGLTLEEAEKRIGEHLKQTLTNPEVQVTTAGKVTRWRQMTLPKAPYQIGAGDSLLICVAGTLIDQPINGFYTVESTGTVPLGPMYGRVKVQGLTLEAAERAIRSHLLDLLTNPQVLVTLGELASRWTTDLPSEPYRIGPGSLLEIHVAGTLDGEPIKWLYVVEPDGRAALGPSYGRVNLDGMSLKQAEQTVARQLREILRQPEVSITLGGWRSDEELKPRGPRLLEPPRKPRSR